MSDDSKPPKGPILPDPNDPNRVGDGKRTNIIDIKETLKERKEKRQQKKQEKTDRRQKGKPEKEKTKKKVNTTVTVETDESHEVDPVKKKQKEEREKFNDKKRIERLRSKVEGWLARFKTEVLPTRKTSAGNNPTRAPVHPIISKKATGMDPNVSNDTTQQPDAARELQNVLAHKKQLTLQNQNQNTFTPPTPKPPGG
jgi:hypothetical protein